MHGDVLPCSPFSAANGLYGRMSIEALYRFCLYSAAGHCSIAWTCTS